MRNQRTQFTIATAGLLVALSVAIMVTVQAPPSAPSHTGWKITLFADGRPIGSMTRDEFPTDLKSLVASSIDGKLTTCTIEPISTVGSNSWLFPSGLASENRSIVEFLLLLPPATLLVCLFRNLIGLNSFGTFAPALLGLAFREVHSPLGLFVVLAIISAGWWLRRVLNELHLLQVPRTALLLSCVVVLLLVLMAFLQGSGPRAITLFPLVILTGMIERFWSMEEEDGTASSLGVLASTLFIAVCVWVMAMIPAVPVWLTRHPETLGLVMAAQLLLGRYTGFRLLELYRFRALAIPTVSFSRALR
ncbi:MAG: hypothetical protein K8T89_03775 [Planctomycetes bacterium]|nr:hypothetical protein [Planctomycetota bacterium]